MPGVIGHRPAGLAASRAPAGAEGEAVRAAGVRQSPVRNPRDNAGGCCQPAVPPARPHRPPAIPPTDPATAAANLPMTTRRHPAVGPRWHRLPGAANGSPDLESPLRRPPMRPDARPGGGRPHAAVRHLRCQTEVFPVRANRLQRRLTDCQQCWRSGPVAVTRNVIVARWTVMPTCGCRPRRIRSGNIASSSLSPTPKH